MYKQWSTLDNKCFFPAGDVVAQLPPGYYSVERSMQGMYLEAKEPKAEKLMKFPDSTSESVVNEIEKFWTMESTFKESKIPYKRGLLLYGPPGSGKTCTIRMVVENLVNSHSGIVIDFPGSSMFKEAYELIRQIHPTIPIVTLMEDLDAILSGGESSTLNLLDGMFNINKVVFLATTNYPEKLGSRILNRPSRFDKKVFIGMPSAEAREVYIRSKLVNENDTLIKKWVSDTNGFSIAHIKELYVAHKILGEAYGDALTTLQMMKETPISNSFDSHELTDKAPWSDYGTGKAYREFKEQNAKAISEGKKYSPTDISRLMLG